MDVYIYTHTHISTNKRFFSCNSILCFLVIVTKVFIFKETINVLLYKGHLFMNCKYVLTSDLRLL